MSNDQNEPEQPTTGDQPQGLSHDEIVRRLAAREPLTFEELGDALEGDVIVPEEIERLVPDLGGKVREVESVLRARAEMSKKLSSMLPLLQASDTLFKEKVASVAPLLQASAAQVDAEMTRIIGDAQQWQKQVDSAVKPLTTLSSPSNPTWKATLAVRDEIRALGDLVKVMGQEVASMATIASATSKSMAGQQRTLNMLTVVLVVATIVIAVFVVLQFLHPAVVIERITQVVTASPSPSP